MFGDYKVKIENTTQSQLNSESTRKVQNKASCFLNKYSSFTPRLVYGAIDGKQKKLKTTAVMIPVLLFLNLLGLIQWILVASSLDFQTGHIFLRISSLASVLTIFHLGLALVHLLRTVCYLEQNHIEVKNSIFRRRTMEK
jgi:hypothetical protein